MSSSVSSERAFSSAGLTITRNRNRLNDEIVEALQVLKTVYRNMDGIMGEGGSTLEDELGALDISDYDSDVEMEDVSQVAGPSGSH